MIGNEGCSTVGVVEGTVTIVVGLVYQKLKDVPDQLPGFLDKQETSRRGSNRGTARSVVLRRGRVQAARRGILNHVDSAFHLVAEKVVPTAANLSGKYNSLVKLAEAKEKEHVDDHRSDSSSYTE
ncbi:hypothetical protein V6N13_005288 [Hibiscus sabdariffa]|uniref:Uncharacterized protein n=1 Tax=Hibiscus sabdariffa TaxID=183260 RepID=A0ABR2ER90_9ROSI